MKSLLLILLIPLSLKAEVLILGDHSQVINYLAETAVNKDVQSFSEALVKERRSEVSTEHLQEKYDYAEFLYFSGKAPEAKATLDTIITNNFNRLLAKEASHLVSKSLLLRANLESTHVNKMYWLNKAFVFDPDYKVEPDKLNLETQKKWRHVISTTPLEVVKLPSTLRMFDKLIVNNQIFDLLKVKSLKWPKGRVSIRLFSNYFAPIETTSTLQSFINSPIKQTTLVSGSCKAYQLNAGTIITPKPSIYFSKNCIVHGGEQPKKLTDLHPAVKPLSPLDSSLMLKPRKQQASKFWKNKWFWAAIGGVAIYYSQQQGKSNPPQQDDVVLPTYQ